jgi:hypothetical protein
MKSLLKKFEQSFMAATFAEENSHDIAREVLNIDPKVMPLDFYPFFNSTMVATTFAEANCPDLAREFIKDQPKENIPHPLNTFLQTVGLLHTEVIYGLVPEF